MKRTLFTTLTSLLLTTISPCLAQNAPPKWTPTSSGALTLQNLDRCLFRLYAGEKGNKVYLYFDTADERPSDPNATPLIIHSQNFTRKLTAQDLQSLVFTKAVDEATAALFKDSNSGQVDAKDMILYASILNFDPTSRTNASARPPVYYITGIKPNGDIIQTVLLPARLRLDRLCN